MYEDEIPVGRAKDLRGQKIGNLTVLYRVKSNCHSTRWKCLCDCGNTTYHYANNLLNNKYSHSCGCQSKKGNNLKYDGYQGQNKIDITGEKFGYLTVLKDSGERKGREVVWLCECDCGNFIKVRSYDLRRGHTISCGCLRSVGEKVLAEFFIKFNINFSKQKTYETCRFPDTNALAKFDFYLPDFNVLIEFDGTIHYKEHIKNNGWNTFERFEKRQEHDVFKNQWCRENGIPLIRIPYWKLDTLCIEDLMLETTQFRVV